MRTWPLHCAWNDPQHNLFDLYRREPGASVSTRGLLAEHLNRLTEEKKPPQVIVSTHSPTLASHVAPSRVSCTFYDEATDMNKCNSLAKVGLTNSEERELRRMLDVTRATLYFAIGTAMSGKNHPDLVLVTFR